MIVGQKNIWKERYQPVIAEEGSSNTRHQGSEWRGEEIALCCRPGGINNSLLKLEFGKQWEIQAEVMQLPARWMHLPSALEKWTETSRQEKRPAGITSLATYSGFGVHGEPPVGCGLWCGPFLCQDMLPQRYHFILHTLGYNPGQKCWDTCTFSLKIAPLRFPPPSSPSQCCISGLKVHFFGATLTRGEGGRHLAQTRPSRASKTERLANTCLIFRLSQGLLSRIVELRAEVCLRLDWASGRRFLTPCILIEPGWLLSGQVAWRVIWNLHLPFYSQKWSISNYPCSLTRKYKHIVWTRLFVAYAQMITLLPILTTSHIYIFLFELVGRMYFLSLGLKGF